jgi:hypothetical protein
MNCTDGVLGTRKAGEIHQRLPGFQDILDAKRWNLVLIDPGSIPPTESGD